MTALLAAVIQGIGGVFLSFLAQRRAQADHDLKNRLQDYAAGQGDATAAEREIETSATQARDTAVPDFGTLR